MCKPPAGPKATFYEIAVVEFEVLGERHWGLPWYPSGYLLKFKKCLLLSISPDLTGPTTGSARLLKFLNGKLLGWPKHSMNN